MNKPTKIMVSRYTDSGGVRRVQVHIDGSPIMPAMRDDEANTQYVAGKVRGLEDDMDRAHRRYIVTAWNGDAGRETVLRDIPA